MKQALIMLTIFVVVFGCSMAGAETKYEVTLKVVYNAVSADEAARIIKDAQERHSSACKNEIQSKKVSGVDDGYAILSSDGTATVTSYFNAINQIAYEDANEAWRDCPDAIKKMNGKWYCAE